LRQLCGYGIYRGLIGHIDKHDPVDLLDDSNGEHIGSSDPMVWARL
jgi:hypothetical protein